MYVVKLGDEVYELLDWQPPPGKPGSAAVVTDRDEPAAPAGGSAGKPRPGARQG